MTSTTDPLGRDLYDLAKTLFPFPRSLTGNGVRRTLAEIQKHLPGLAVHEVPSGTRAFDWTVPDEWNVEDAYVLDARGRRVIDWKKNNLHLVGYSVPVDVTLSREELDQHLHSLPNQPTAIPYVTSYYARRWGFCLSHRARRALKKGTYRAVIKSRLAPGSMTYGELLLPGREPAEVLLSTYVCHPSMANNECSGPAVTTFLAKALAARTARRLSYRVVFVPETIGAILYLSRNLEALRRSTVAGYVVTCVGDDRVYSFLPSRLGDTLADRMARHVLKHRAPRARHYSYLQRGSDERQYGWPGVDLPVASIMRSKYHEYPEYHTSLDDLKFISPRGLAGAYRVLQETLDGLESNGTFQTTVLGEPQLGPRGLYASLGTKKTDARAEDYLNLLAYCDGTRDLLAVAEIIQRPLADCAQWAALLMEHGLLRRTA
jgi:aminopeptidase-like protein